MQPYFEENGFFADVDFISVSTGAEENRVNYPPNLWLEREGWSAPLIVDNEDNAVSTAFGLNAFPFWTAVDAEGRVVFRTAGALSKDGLVNLAQSLANL